MSVEVDDIRKEFCHNTVKNIEDRFPKEAVDVAMAFHVLGMHPGHIIPRNKGKTTAARNWRKEDVVSKSLIDADQVRQELSLT